MAERKAQNKYYPPNWEPKFGPLNKYVKHASRVTSMPHGNVLHRTREKLPYLGKKVRFEMPYSIWCSGCKKHIGMGVRYNAHKQEIDKYLSTPIFRFSMKCHLCPSYIVIDTDPINTQYIIRGGATKREDTYDPASIGLIVLPEKEETLRLENDAFYRLEHGLEDVKTAEVRAVGVEEIISYSDQFYKDPYTVSQILRKKFRVEKKAALVIENESKKIQDRLALSVDILPSSQEDAKIAKTINWQDDIRQRQNIRDQNIFEAKGERPVKAVSTLGRAIQDSRIGKKHIMPRLNTKFREVQTCRNSRQTTARETIHQIVSSSRRGDPFNIF